MGGEGTHTVRIAYGVQTTGRGHITSCLALREELLQRGHQVFILSSGMGVPEYFRGLSFHRPGPTFAVRRARISAARTALRFARHMHRYRRSVADFETELSRLNPDLVIVNFEPLTSRAAERLALPTVSIDHQHFNLIPGVPRPPRGSPSQLRNEVSARVVLKRWIRPCNAYLLCSLFRFDHRSSSERIIPPILDRKVLEMRNRLCDDGFLLVYQSVVFDSAPILQFAREHSDIPIRVYTDHPPGEFPNIEFRALNRDDFLSDLSSCTAYVGTAGFESVAEAVLFGKRILVCPVRGQWEQQVNAYQAAHTGLGRKADRLTADAIEALLASPPPEENGEIISWLCSGAGMAADAIEEFATTGKL